jgi:uncharacterized membrane protein HdeD (DUF308 family)
MAAREMRRIHLWVGALTVVVFVVSGQLMRHHQPLMDTLPDRVRLMFRSRHIYILASGLVNLMLGLYMQPAAAWRRVVQLVGSAMLVMSPASLMAAFKVETASGFRPEMFWSSLGLYLLFGGCMLPVVGSIGGAGKRLIG